LARGDSSLGERFIAGIQSHTLTPGVRRALNRVWLASAG